MIKLKKLRESLKRLFCRHHTYQEVVCWHWFHGFNMNDYAYIEMQLRCKKCNKLHFEYIKDIKFCNEFAEIYKDMRWSDKCKPMLNMKYSDKEK